jgi:predicted nucleotidyltransferase
MREDALMLLAPESTVCGVPAAMAKDAACFVQEAQWCSAGALARRLGIAITASRLLLEALEAEQRLTRYTGRLADGHDGLWLPEEEASREPLVLWHLRYPAGMALAKAWIGSPVPRDVARSLLSTFLGRVTDVNGDPTALHTIERVLLYGSLTDPDRQQVSDVDLLVYARRVSVASAGDSYADRARAQREAESVKVRLEARLRAGDERLDVSVIDESTDGWTHLPDGAVTIEVFPSGSHEAAALA